ncbi:MAG: glycine cleavage system aminomethyltransferase GcvT [SAR202 cluster bacterium]|nr:glycine cleavage system protein T [Chloroflexota bacterium]MQG50945.1 glycine cleavage system aminomethyltransferase GcvT [SAR202 cluster bacterium]|tara:strand:- start:5813 stop:6889 length:1077 start_codon:yes stop_codon:yes gene_type:complete
MGKRTTLYNNYFEKAKIVDFHGWDLPIQFSGIINEVKSVRSNVGIFDVSHMGRIICNGELVDEFLNYLLTGDLLNLEINQASYMFLCNEYCGIIDDLVAYKTDANEIMIVCNASNKEQVITVLKRYQYLNSDFGNIMIEDFTDTSGMIAVQGPMSQEIMCKLFNIDQLSIRRFRLTRISCEQEDVIISRTGYTGENGFEIISSAKLSSILWDKLINLGAIPCGLGSRDVLRIEAGLSLHGNDISSDINPKEAQLERFVTNTKETLYKQAWDNIQNTPTKKTLIGFIIKGRGIPRINNSIFLKGESIGYVTSGTFSPTLDLSIGLGYVTKKLDPNSNIEVEIREKKFDAIVTKLPFLRR